MRDYTGVSSKYIAYRKHFTSRKASPATAKLPALNQSAKANDHVSATAVMWITLTYLVVIVAQLCALVHAAGGKYTSLNYIRYILTYTYVV